MRRAFLICGLLFATMYAVAMATLDRPKHDGLVHLTWSTDDNPARKVQMALFDRMYPGLDVYIDPALGGDSSKLIVQCATGTGPDVVEVSGVQNMHTLVDAGILLDLTPYAKSMGFDPARTYPAIKDGLEIDGRQYRFPRNVWANAVIYNKAIFRDHGVPFPKPGWTHEDFVRAGKAIIDNPSKSGETHLAVANYSNVGMYKDMLIGEGGRLFRPDGLRSALADPPSVAAIQKYFDMMYVDKIIPTPADSASMSSQGGWGSGGLNWFSSGKAAMIIIGRWYIIQVPNYPNLKGNMGAVALPRLDGRPSSGACDAGSAGVNVKSPRWRAALKFLQYLSTPAYSKVIVDDGDSLPPNPAVATSGKALANDDVPDPAFHQPFVDAINHARPLDVSPYVDAMEVDRWTGEYVEKVENRLMTPRAAMQALAAQIDTQIRVNLERRPDLQKLYEQRTGKPYRADWWRSP
jgi:multiple sugar transport system substrate-binding protein